MNLFITPNDQLIMVRLKQIAQACLGEKFEGFRHYRTMENNHIHALLKKDLDIEIESYDYDSDDLMEWFERCADKFLEKLPREDRLERTKHLTSLISRWCEFQEDIQ
jgi:hypothetical protein